MSLPVVRRTRRAFLSSLALGAAAFSAPGAFADQFERTPPMTEGPFYPDQLPSIRTTI
jgi:protocatechuate 3,4-dioxygenase beta subunit